jgi:hypothetical protein
MDTEIIVVSGLPRSGTSVMMQMLANGGIEVVTDNIRAPDTDNPRGYYEYELVKKIKKDTSWLPATRGKAFKMVSQLLYDLPPSERYRIVFMERDFGEMLASQEKMLRRLKQPVAPTADMARAYTAHLDKLNEWLAHQKNMALLHIKYHDLIERPAGEVARLNEFLGGKLKVEEAVKTVDPALYRNRKPKSE